MKIGYLAEPYEENNASGMGHATLELMSHLIKAGEGRHEFVIYSSRKISPAVVPGTYAARLVPKSMLGRFWYFLRLKDDIDVLIFNAPLSALVLPKRIKSVPICHELVPLRLPRNLSKGELLAFVRDWVFMPMCLKAAAHIGSPSRMSKDMVSRVYNVPQEKVSLIYNGFQKLESSDYAKVDASMKPYFFFTGKVKERKNVHGIVNAYVEFMARAGADCKLVISGDHEGAYFDGLIKTLEKNGLRQKTFFLGYVSNAMLGQLYKGAIAFVFPSFSEGFGMPIVEAFSVGTPVITSSITATAEIAGEAAILVDPNDTEAISKAMEDVWGDDNLRKRLSQKGLERAKLFSWGKAAQEYLRLIETL